MFSVHVGVQSVSGDPGSVLSIQSVQDPFMKVFKVLVETRGVF